LIPVMSSITDFFSRSLYLEEDSVVWFWGMLLLYKY
jgi:hypothetical protein